MRGSTPAVNAGLRIRYEHDDETPSVQTIRDYLLGQLPESETERLDELSITDDECAERIRAVEHDLVDEYARGELQGVVLEQFRSRYLTTPTATRRDSIRRSAAVSRREFRTRQLVRGRPRADDARSRDTALARTAAACRRGHAGDCERVAGARQPDASRTRDERRVRARSDTPRGRGPARGGHAPAVDQPRAVAANGRDARPRATVAERASAADGGAGRRHRGSRRAARSRAGGLSCVRGSTRSPRVETGSCGGRTG